MTPYSLLNQKEQMSQSQLFVKNNMKASVKMSCKVLNCFELIDFIVFLSFFCIFKKRCPAHRVDNEIKIVIETKPLNHCINTVDAQNVTIRILL